MKVIPKALQYSRQLVEKSIEPGDKAIDATVGNGKDTEWLAMLVGEEGLVYGFDVQEIALKRTRERLQSKGLLDRVKLIQQGHQCMENYLYTDSATEMELESENKMSVGAVMFNLGYLPGSDRQVITRPETTIKAIHKSLELIKKSGVITVVVYTGHAGGKEEEESILSCLMELSGEFFRVLHYRFVNQTGNPPQLFAVERI